MFLRNSIKFPSRQILNRSKFTLSIPEKFNFAQDIIDNHASNPIRSKSIALHHVSEIQGSRKWNFEELSNDSKKVASGLSSLGKIRKSLLILPRIPEWWILNIAAMRSKIILLPGTTQLTSDDIKNRLLISKADTVIVDKPTAEKIETISKDSKNNLEQKIFISQENCLELENQGWINYHDLINQPLKDLEPVETSSKEIMQIFFTSGTTGAPKMCAHTQGTYGFCHSITAKHWLDLKSDDVHWNISDTGWAKAAWSNIFAPWSQGSCVYVHDMPRFEAQKVLTVLETDPITTLCAPPTLYRSLIQLDISKFANLRHCVSAGEPLNEEVIKAWHDKTGIWIREGYGQTETTLIAATTKNMKVKPGSMGKAAPGYNVKIIDNEAQELLRGQEGHIAVQLEPDQEQIGLFSGYVDNPEMTQKSFLKDFYLTGDRGFMDEDDYIWFSSRKDDVIISAGYRIGPFEVESALIQHPAVLESAAVASPDPERGHVVKAFIVLSPEFEQKIQNSLLTETELISELQNYAKKTTAPYKYPRKIEFVSELPKTVSGKIRRNELRKKEFGGK